MFHARSVREKGREGKLRPARDEMKLLPPRKVRLLNCNCVEFLGLDCDPAGTQKWLDLTRAQFEQLTLKQVPFLVPEQMKWLPPGKVPLLEKPNKFIGA